MRQDRPFLLDKCCIFLLWLPVGLSLINLWRVVFMGTQELIYTIISATAVIVAALIAGIVTLIVQSKQLKRDGRIIDSISSDTSNMMPKIENTNSAVNSMVKGIDKIEERNSKIDAMATEIEVFKRLKSEAGGSMVKPEVLLAAISSVLEENANLRQRHQEDQQKILALSVENNRLQLRNQQLESTLKQQAPAPSGDEEWEP